MSVTRSPRLEAIRRREEEADRKKLFAAFATLLFLVSFCFVAAIVTMGHP